MDFDELLDRYKPDALLENVGAVSPDAGDYEPVSKLHVANGEISQLTYERRLRRLAEASVR